jgi:hypothetical protein
MNHQVQCHVSYLVLDLDELCLYTCFIFRNLFFYTYTWKEPISHELYWGQELFELSGETRKLMRLLNVGPKHSTSIGFTPVFALAGISCKPELDFVVAVL